MAAVAQPRAVGDGSCLQAQNFGREAQPTLLSAAPPPLPPSLPALRPDYRVFRILFRNCGLLAQCSDNWGLAVPGPRWGHWGDGGIFWFAPRFLFIGSLLLGRAFLLGGLVNLSAGGMEDGREICENKRKKRTNQNI